MVANKTLTVMVVEDDENIREMLVDILCDEYQTVAASNGNRAWEYLREKSSDIDVVLTDIKMPEMDGFELLSRITESYPRIGVIMISASQSTDAAIDAIKKGAYDYILKPIKRGVEIKLVLDRWKYQQSLEAKLDQYASLHRQLMENMKVRTFLAIDVVDSLKAKSGEDPVLVQSVFSSYQAFVREITENNQGYIHDTSGDGAMAVFNHPSSAVETGIQILDELARFNSRKNLLAKSFEVRIGIHTGAVIQHEAGEISQIFSQSLDTAGHLQKVAAPNSLLISEATLEVIGDTDKFGLTDVQESGFRVYKYLPTTS